jgi:cbb3-type cytochrome oxidase subunit 3
MSMKIFCKKNLLTLIIAAFFFSWFFIGESALAQGLKDAGNNLEGISGAGGVTLSSDVEGMANRVVRSIFYLLGTIFLILVIYGGIVWMKAAGRDEEVARAKRIVSTSVIGIIVLMMSYAITIFVMSRLGGA